LPFGTTPVIVPPAPAHWQDDYYVTSSDGAWSASPFADRTVILTAETAHGLKIAMQDDYAKRASP
jgi:hypothetical protein